MAERQMATTLEEVRLDHRMRYEFAINELARQGKLERVADIGCGVGYGSNMLSEYVDQVTSVEISKEAQEIYREHWAKHNIDFISEDLLQLNFAEPFDAVVCFEFIEHITFYDEAIEKFSQWSDLLVISTPNERVRPHLQEPVNPFHVRHFTPEELQEIMKKHGFRTSEWYCQASGSEPEIRPGTNGKFIIAVASRKAATKRFTFPGLQWLMKSAS